MVDDPTELRKQRFYRNLAFFSLMFGLGFSCISPFIVSHKEQMNPSHGEAALLFPFFLMIVFSACGIRALFALVFGLMILRGPERIGISGRAVSLAVYLLEFLPGILLALSNLQNSSALEQVWSIIYIVSICFTIYCLVMVYWIVPYEPVLSTPPIPSSPPTSPSMSNDEIESTGTWDEAKLKK